MSNCITTFSGAHIAPTNPDASQIHIPDIAHALSLLCRGNGHVQTFFSVGQHCIHCALEAEARGYSNRLVLACLLHDASEAYVCDIPRPFKQCLPQYKTYENHLLDIIYTKYLGAPLTDEEEKLVKKIDDDMLYYDLEILLKEKPDSPRPVMQTVFSYQVLPFTEVEQRYLALFEKYHSCKA